MTLHPRLEAVLLLLQVLQVAFLALHDWLPIPPLNDVAAVRGVDSTSRLVAVTLIQTLPFALGLWFCFRVFPLPYPHWLRTYLLVSYGILALGQLRAWWIPYLLRPEPVRAARYQTMFGNTHSLLTKRNGIVPNTLHVLLHAATTATLAMLALSPR